MMTSRCTSPTIVLSAEDEDFTLHAAGSAQSLGSSLASPSLSPASPSMSRRSSGARSRKSSGSRKNSFVSCLSPNIRS